MKNYDFFVRIKIKTYGTLLSCAICPYKYRIPSIFPFTVGREGVEPSRCHHRRILSPLRLPIPPSPRRDESILSQLTRASMDFTLLQSFKFNFVGIRRFDHLCPGGAKMHPGRRKPAHQCTLFDAAFEPLSIGEFRQLYSGFPDFDGQMRV